MTSVAPTASTRDRLALPRPLLVLAVAALLGTHLVLAFRGVLGRSVTADEIAHVTAGCAYWQFNDYRLQPENGNLPQRWGALGFQLGSAQLDPAAREFHWSMSVVWLVGHHFFFDSGQNTDLLLLAARTWMLFWSVCAGLLVFGWSRSLWGNSAGLFSLTLYAFSPTVLAHAPLVTSDLCAAFWLLLATAALARACRTPSFGRAVSAGAAIGLACVAKYSALLLLPVAMLLTGAALLRAWRHAPRREWKRTATRLSAAATGALAVTVALVWGFYGARFSADNAGLPALRSFYPPWNDILAPTGFVAGAIGFLREHRLLPEGFIYGLTHVLSYAQERGAFAAGAYSTTGWWWFFPFAFAVKSTMGELVIAGIVFARLAFKIIRSRISDWGARALNSPLLPLMTFAGVYGIAALTSNLNIGHRHLLPLYLVLFIVAGSLAAHGVPKLVRVLATAALLGSVAEATVRQPHSLAFFNVAAGGPANGWRLLADSSLDWGQDVSALGAWVRENRRDREPVYVSTFGTADPFYEGIEGKLLSPYFWLGGERRWFELTPGLYCISATMLQDVYGVKPGLWDAEAERDFQNLKLVARAKLASGEWSSEIPPLGMHPQHPLWLLDRLRFARLCQYLRLREPEAVINHTQFVFRLSAHEIEVLVDRPFSEVAALMETARRRNH